MVVAQPEIRSPWLIAQETTNWTQDPPTSVASLCEVCAAIDFEDVFTSREGEGYGAYESRRYQHHDNRATLALAAAAGCDLCRLLDRALVKNNDTSTAPFALGPGYASSYISAGPPMMTHDFRLDYHQDQQNRFQSTIVARLSVVSLAGKHQVVDSRPVAVRAPLPLCLGLLQQCETQHAECIARSDECELPTRVIDIGKETNSEIRLVETNGLRGQYVTLSHCWGLNRPLVTAEATYASHLEGIPFLSLPQTYQHAVTVTRALGHRYLWIDSLCIIQDSKADWEIQCTRMDGIYENSFITIAALSSTSATTGFLNQPRTATDELHRLPGRPDSGFDLAFGPYTRRPLDRWANCPLFGRAWVQQERALSRRLLGFRTDGLVFVCMAHEVRESVWPAQEKLSLAGKASERMNGEAEVRQAWYELVRGYCGTQLTFKLDKLPAISGIARRFQQKTINETGDEDVDSYLAGLWRSDLPRQLLWYVCTMHPVAAVRQTAYIAPSWSWASNTNQISWKDDGQGKPPLTQYIYATILSASTTPAGLDDLGQVTSGTLRIRGRITEFVIGPGLLRAYEPSWEVRKLSQSLTAGPSGKFWSDAAGDEAAIYGKDDGCRVQCLLLHADSPVKAKAHFTYALALKSISESVYSRIGLVELEDGNAIEVFWSDAETCEVTII